jgi:hypothetical protein
MGKRGPKSSPLKAYMPLSIFKAYDALAYAAVKLDIGVEQGLITTQAREAGIEKVAAEIEKKLRTIRNVPLKSARGPKSKLDTVLRQAIIEQWQKTGRPFNNLKEYLVFALDKTEKLSPLPKEIMTFARVSGSSLNNSTRDRNRYSAQIIAALFISRRMNYWRERLA